MAEKFNFDYFHAKLKIADLNVDLSYGSERVKKQIQNYIYDFDGAADIVVHLDKDWFLERYNKKHSEDKRVTPEVYEYLATGSRFHKKLLDYDGFILHSSAVIYNGGAYLFSAPCGTGKSTHTGIWQKCFGKDVIMLNDDKPAIRYTNGRWRAYGTPWSGKHNLQTNISAPVAGLAFIERSEINTISRLESHQAVVKLMSQTVRPKETDRMEKLMMIAGCFVEEVPIYRLCCNMDDEAAYVAYEAMGAGFIADK